ncbi:hypothetical protein E8E12_008415 [Didymella heteroderae]|uniref:Uncharacterized protein n=1 Tax=Didymella heteroderae TaxID=1769908 RepID=A0A9P4WSM1_9PLEO|nr:hypothetical protein E8E12_008415 [Didymella heteroderae]
MRMVKRYRLWVTQEIALATRVRLFLCTDTYDLAGFHLALSAIAAKAQNAVYIVNHVYEVLQRLNGFRRTQDMIRESRRCEDIWITWPQVLGNLSDKTQFTEPLIKVYAVMGLVHTDLQIDPDYTMNSKQLMAKIVCQTIAFWESRDPQYHRHLWPELWDLMVNPKSSFGYDMPNLDVYLSGTDCNLGISRNLTCPNHMPNSSTLGHT